MKQQKNDASRIIPLESLSFFGEGTPVGNDPGRMAQRRLSQTLAYLCRAGEKTAAELAEEMRIPIFYIEEELEQLCRGANGQYGLLRRTGNGKYIANIIISNRDEYEAVNALYRKYAPSFCRRLADSIVAGQGELDAFMRRHLPKNAAPRLLLWALIPDIVGNFMGQVGAGLAESFPDVTPSDRTFTAMAVANMPDQNAFYDCDSIIGHQIWGYSDIMVRNLYGNRLQAHFRCGHNLAADPLLRLTIRCAEGLPFSALCSEDRAIAERAIHQGYLRERDGILEPAILILADGISVYIEFQSLLGALEEDTRELARRLAGELGEWMRGHIPVHLLSDYPYYNSCIASQHFFYDVVEECIHRGILEAPHSSLGPEGVLMVLCT